jgi:hypothetical protein
MRLLLLCGVLFSLHARAGSDSFVGSYRLTEGNCPFSGSRLLVKVERPGFLSLVDGANDDGPLLFLPLAESESTENRVVFRLQERARRVITLERTDSGLTVREESDAFRCAMFFAVDTSILRLQ